jgi:hypothetical protein
MDAIEPLADDIARKRFGVDDDIGELRHSEGIRDLRDFVVGRR